jgi:hypothetical protein
MGNGCGHPSLIPHHPSRAHPVTTGPFGPIERLSAARITFPASAVRYVAHADAHGRIANPTIERRWRTLPGTFNAKEVGSSCADRPCGASLRRCCSVRTDILVLDAFRNVSRWEALLVPIGKQDGELLASNGTFPPPSICPSRAPTSFKT